MKQLVLIISIYYMSSALAFAQVPPGPLDPVNVDAGALITQIGDFNDGDINQTGHHSAETYQEGNMNEGYLVQSGVGNTGFISQVGDDNYGAINIYGLNNTGIIVQEGENHNIQFSMDGEDNVADIRQFGTSDHSVGFAESLASVFQSGDRNQFYSVQIGDAIGHTITTVGGASEIQQGNDNLIDVWQEGSGHVAELLQTGDFNSMDIYQSGDGNTTIVDQSGMYNVASVYQNGSGNSGIITQSN